MAPSEVARINAAQVVRTDAAQVAQTDAAQAITSLLAGADLTQVRWHHSGPTAPPRSHAGVTLSTHAPGYSGEGALQPPGLLHRVVPGPGCHPRRRRKDGRQGRGLRAVRIYLVPGDTEASSRANMRAMSAAVEHISSSAEQDFHHAMARAHTDRSSTRNRGMVN
jgi:hypothetical protein